MFNITNAAALARALDSPIADNIKALLVMRRDQLAEYVETDIGELAHWIIIDPGDRVSDVEATAAYPVITEPAFEWVLNHGGVYELVTILSDDGFGVVLIVPEIAGIVPELLTLCRDQAQAA